MDDGRDSVSDRAEEQLHVLWGVQEAGAGTRSCKAGMQQDYHGTQCGRYCRDGVDEHVERGLESVGRVRERHFRGGGRRAAVFTASETAEIRIREVDRALRVPQEAGLLFNLMHIQSLCIPRARAGAHQVTLEQASAVDFGHNILSVGDKDPGEEQADQQAEL